MKKSLIVIIGLLALFVLPFIAVAQENPYSISGLVLDERSKPIQNVGIYRIDSTFLTITDKNGVFNLKNVKTGDTIYTRHLSYKSVMHVIDTLVRWETPCCL